MAEAELGKIVNMIMDNPELVEQIRALGSEKPKSEDEVPRADPEPLQIESSAEKTEAVSFVSHRTKRNELLRAIKPFLKEKRQKSLETMITIADVLETMQSK